MKCILRDKGWGRVKMLMWENTPAPPNFHIQPRPQNTLRDTRRECRLMCETDTLANKKTLPWMNIYGTHSFLHTLKVWNFLSNTAICKHTHIAFSTFTTIWLRQKSAKLINDCSRRGNHKRSQRWVERKHVNLIIFPSSFQIWRWVDVVKPILLKSPNVPKWDTAKQPLDGFLHVNPIGWKNGQ